MDTSRSSFEHAFETRRWALGNLELSFPLRQAPRVLDTLVAISQTNTVLPSDYVAAMTECGVTQEAAVAALEEHIELGIVMLTGSFTLLRPHAVSLEKTL